MVMQRVVEDMNVGYSLAESFLADLSQAASRFQEGGDSLDEGVQHSIEELRTLGLNALAIDASVDGMPTRPNEYLKQLSDALGNFMVDLKAFYVRLGSTYGMLPDGAKALIRNQSGFERMVVLRDAFTRDVQQNS